MAYDLSQRLVIGLASSALFDLSESDKIFKEKGETDYRKYQRQNENTPLEKGVAFPFIEKLLSINQINPENPPIEVILLSRNDPDTGLRVMNSVDKYGLGISRALFLQGKDPHVFIETLEMDLFLSANESDVLKAIEKNYPAGMVLESVYSQEMWQERNELMIAFDFDGVLIDDESEKVYQENGLESFSQYEHQNSDVPHNKGLLFDFLKKLSKIQEQEYQYHSNNPQYQPILRTAIVTARSSPTHKRAIATLRDWNINVNEAYFLGGVNKAKVLDVLKPHIFFDDQMTHLENTKNISPSVHIPFGIANQKIPTKK